MVSLPIYAFFVHLVTLISVFTIWAFRDRRIPTVISLIFSIICISFIVSQLDLSDYGIYYQIYGEIDPDLPFFDSLALTPFEIGYFALNYFSRSFIDNFDALRIGIIFIILLLKIAFLVRWGKFYLISFLFYLGFIWYPDSYLLRSSLAASIALLGFWAILANRPMYQFFVPIIVASTFHSSALILMPFWWLRNFKFSKMQSFALLTSIIFIGIFGIGHLIVNIIAGFLSVDIVLVDTLVQYSESQYGESAGIMRISVLVYVFITALYINYRNILLSRIYGYDLILCMLLFSLLLLLGLSDFLVLSDRLFRLTGFFFSIAIGQIFYCVKKEEQNLFLFIALIFCNIFPYFQPGLIPLLN